MDDLLNRIRDAGALARLAEIIVEDVLARPVGELIEPGLLGDAIRAMSASDVAQERVARWLVATAEALGDEARPLVKLVPPALAAGARELVELPFTPRAETVMKVMDRPAVKRLLRAQVVAMLVDFARRAASPITDNPIARGLGGLSRMAFSRQSTGKLGAFASAVSGEVERQAEKRAAEFADTAVSQVLAGIAGDLADAGRARDQAEVRGAILDGVLALSPGEVMEPLRANIARASEIARRAFAGWAASPAFEAELRAFLDQLLGEDAGRPLGQLLGDLGLRDVAAARARALVTGRLHAILGGEAFARWLAEVLAPP